MINALSFFDMKKETDPWAPLSFAVAVVGGFVGLVLVGGLAGLLTSGSLLGYGSDDVCVSLRPGTLPYGGSSAGDVGFTAMKPDISQSPELVQVCDLTASAGQHALYAADQAAEILFILGFLLLAALLIRAARAHGTFSPQVARRLTGIGAFVIVGALLVAAAQAVLRSRLVATMTTSGDGAAVLMMVHVSVAILIAGFGALTAGRVMTRSVALQREVDTLV